MRVVCIDDSNRPIGIPLEKWVENGKEYTIVKFVRMCAQNNILGVELEEVDLSGCFPYEYFSAKRFVPINPKEKIEEALEEIQEEEIEEII
jgi:hypothetical protein